MTDNTSSLWRPEGDWAEREWRARFENERHLLLAKGNAINSSATYGQIAAVAARLFEDIGGQLVNRIQPILSRCDELDHLGAEDAIVTWTLEPITRAARKGIPGAQQVARQGGFQNIAQLKQGIEPHQKAIDQTAMRLRQQIQRDVKLRRQAIETAKTNSAQKTTNERWQRLHHQANVFNIWITLAALTAGYLLGKIDAVNRAYLWIKAFFGTSQSPV